MDATSVATSEAVGVQPVVASGPRWNFDLAHSSVDFWVRHLMVSKVHGQFGRWSGQMLFDETHPEAARVEVRIDAASVQTREQQRDTHLRSADFFDVEKYPEISFRSTGVEVNDDANYRVTGDLTLHGTTKPVVLDVEYAGRTADPWGGERAGFTAKTTISRKAFGLGWNQAIEAGGVLVGDKVEIGLEIEAVRESR